MPKKSSLEILGSSPNFSTAPRYCTEHQQQWNSTSANTVQTTTQKMTSNQLSSTCRTFCMVARLPEIEGCFTLSLQSILQGHPAETHTSALSCEWLQWRDSRHFRYSCIYYSIFTSTHKRVSYVHIAKASLMSECEHKRVTCRLIIYFSTRRIFSVNWRENTPPPSSSSSGCQHQQIFRRLAQQTRPSLQRNGHQAAGSAACFGIRVPANKKKATMMSTTRPGTSPCLNYWFHKLSMQSYPQYQLW